MISLQEPGILAQQCADLGAATSVHLGTLWLLHAQDQLGLGVSPDDLSVQLDRALEHPDVSMPSRLSWCSSVGLDGFGVFAEVALEGVRFKMRYIPSGSFMMGSSEDEEGRDEDEGPRHQVTLTEGFWLCETPCTQALWQAVMGDNPSEFKSPDRPVENVSFFDCQRFLEALNQRVAGLSAQLPTEAQWEYACRAGSQEARYGELAQIAWHGKNSDQGFELDNGLKTYEGVKGAGTHPVKQKAPNAWGLYDTLGNIWEWCSDWYGDYDSDHVIDPIGPHEGVGRVLRGGSWHGPARYVRAAYRSDNTPDFRLDNCGFRLSRGQKMEIKSGK